MKQRMMVIMALVAIFSSTWSSPVPNVWPMPQSIDQGNETLIISNPCQLSYEIHAASLTNEIREYYTDALKFFESVQLNQYCQETTGALPQSTIRFPPPTTTATRFGRKYIAAISNNTSSTFHIFVRNPQEIPMVPGTTSENYTLYTSQNGTAIFADNFVGLTRALATLSQLLESNNDNGAIVIRNTPITVNDSPRYPYRGIMIDTARHFISVETLLHTIDALSLNKLNVFHWHITDSDSFPIEMPSHPNMTNGAFSTNQIYTKEDVENVVNHAKARGVAIIPELDAPSHSRSWGGASEWTNYLTCLDPGFPYWGIPIGMLDVTQDRTYELLQDLYNDFQKGYFKDFKHLHIGADEVQQGCVEKIPGINDFMQSHGLNDTKDVFNYFVNRSKSLVDNQTRRIYWSNLDTLYLKFEEKDLIQWWGNSSGLEQGFATYPNNQFILSNYDYLYIDCGMGSPVGNKSWCTYSTWGHIYSFEPDNLITKEEYRKNVFGAELAMWNEIGNDFTVGTKVWPRGVAFAERVWSQKNCTGSDPVNRFIRMNAQNNRLINIGVRTGPLSSGYCEQHPDDCAFDA